MNSAANEGKLYDRLEINPTDYAIETFIPTLKFYPFKTLFDMIIEYGLGNFSSRNFRHSFHHDLGTKSNKRLECFLG